MVTVAFFYGLVLLQNRVFETEKEKILRAENEAFKKHEGTVESDIYAAQVQLATLNSKEEDIYKRIFLTEKPISASAQNAARQLLSLELHDFKNTVDGLMEKVKQSHHKAVVTNVHFARLFWPKKQDMVELQSYPTQIPVKNFSPDRLSCGFGEHINPFNKLLYRHKGIDIAAEKGSDVMASGEGRVVSTIVQTTPYGAGNYIEIEHEKGYRTKYAHLGEIKVTRGQKVKQGQIIGTIGTSGGAVSPHLHYEVSKNGNLIDPIYFFTEQLNEKEWLGLIESNKKIKQALD
jgi:murein DD-endopeptidase MepM/ murein hydrolase activator NlpD